MRAITWTEKYPDHWVARVAGNPDELASVKRKVNGQGWLVNLPSQGPTRKLHPCASAEVGKRHAERWLRTRLDRIAPVIGMPDSG